MLIACAGVAFVVCEVVLLDLVPLSVEFTVVALPLDKSFNNLGFKKFNAFCGSAKISMFSISLVL